MKSRDDVENEELENFEEAIKATNTALQPTKVSSATETIMNDPKCVCLDRKSEDFWIMARGLKDFVDSLENSGGLLPVRGVIPDMFSDSERYINLLNVYRNKATADAEAVHKRVQTHLESVGKPAVRCCV
jgi:amyloid beta precursor protein binding protein 1